MEKSEFGPVPANTVWKFAKVTHLLAVDWRAIPFGKEFTIRGRRP